MLGTWRALLGQNVIELSDLDAVCETIALTVGLGEEAIDLDEGLSDLRDAGSTAGSDRRAGARGHRRLPRRHRWTPRPRPAPPPAPRALPAGGAGHSDRAGQADKGTSPGGGTRTRSDDKGTDLPPGRRCERAAVNGHVIVVDLGYGDAGKGTIVDWLCARAAGDAPRRRQASDRPVQAVVRFNGGAQAAHHVLARGTRQPARRTRSPSSARARSPPGPARSSPGSCSSTRSRWSRRRSTSASSASATRFGLVAIDRDALLTTPYHRAANQAREAGAR